MTQRAGYLMAPSGPVLILEHRPDEATARDTAVLLLGPFGWDDTASYRARRAWAASLCAEGHTVVRVDLRGTGDSPGGPQDDGLLDAWSATVGSAVGRLREEGHARVAVVGIGLGGFVAARAVAGGTGVDALVLWGVPRRGRALVRELEAFARLQLGDAAEDITRAGDIVAGGFCLAGGTADALRAVDLTTLSLAEVPASRVLVLGRDAAGADPAVETWFREAGWEVTGAPGAGYAQMHDVPHESQLPDDVRTLVSAWLAAAPRTGPVRASTSASTVEMEAGDATVRESVVTFPAGFGELLGVLTEPAGTPADATVVLLNAGAIRRIGPSRMWTEAARRWAARGVATLRADLEGIGDADGEDARDADVALYVPRYLEQVTLILDALERRGLPGTFVVAGLCSGSFWALHTALDDPRVRAAVLLNPRLLAWDPVLPGLRRARDVVARAQAPVWRRALRGEWTPRQMATLAGRLVRAFVLRRRARGAGVAVAEPVVRRIETTTARLWIGFSGEEPLHDELAASGTLDRLLRLPHVEMTTLPGTDHTLRSLPAQRAAHELLDHAIAREVALLRTGS